VRARCTLLRPPRDGMVQQHLAHHARRRREEMGAVPPLHLMELRQLQIGLVDQRGGVERVVGPLAAESPTGNPLELVVDDGKHRVERGSLALGVLPEQPGQIRSTHEAPAWSVVPFQ
jgi:hypothetical protein